MTSHVHAAIWIDHQEARIFHVERDSFDEKKLAAPHRHLHKHPKGSGEAHNHPDDMNHFFADVAKELADAEQILVLGPSTAKLHLVRYLHKHHSALEAKVVGLETVDHPTDPQLVSHARKYFIALDPKM